MNVLSLFDGMSCGQIALNKLGVKYDKYFACEIDKYAMQVTQHNFPDTIQLGDVQFVTKETFGNHKIDLVVGGSPCQGFSFAGKMLNFDDARSKLFFEYVRLVKELKPKYFLLENVKMKKESQDIISEYMGVEPIEINSSLVSAQTRKRLYWTNIPNVGQPEDKGIVLKDIIESGMAGEEPVKHTERNKRHLKDVDGKSLCTTATMYKGAGNNGMTLIQVDDKLRHPEATKKGYAEAGEGEGLDLTFPDSKTRRGRSMKDKSNCLTAASQEMGIVESFEVSEKRKKIIEKNLGDRINDETEIIGSSQKNAYVGKDKSSSLTGAMGEGGGHVPMLKIDPSKPNQINPDKSAKSSSENEKGTQPHMQDRVFHEDGKSHAFTSSFASRTKVGKNDKKLSWRKLTPLECERLQTVPDGYTLVIEDDKQKVSNSQRYKMLGNGWTIDVITHIMKNMEL